MTTSTVAAADPARRPPGPDLRVMALGSVRQPVRRRRADDDQRALLHPAGQGFTAAEVASRSRWPPWSGMLVNVPAGQLADTRGPTGGCSPGSWSARPSPPGRPSSRPDPLAARPAAGAAGALRARPRAPSSRASSPSSPPAGAACSSRPTCARSPTPPSGSARSSAGPRWSSTSRGPTSRSSCSTPSSPASPPGTPPACPTCPPYRRARASPGSRCCATGPYAVVVAHHRAVLAALLHHGARARALHLRAHRRRRR